MIYRFRISYNYGEQRHVLLIDSFAIKIPRMGLREKGWSRFREGLRANCQEKLFSRTNWPELCPVIAWLWDLVIVMRRAQPLSDEEFKSFDYASFVDRQFRGADDPENRAGCAGKSIDPKDDLVPVECRLESFGRLNGKIVAIDYGGG